MTAKIEHSAAQSSRSRRISRAGRWGRLFVGLLVLAAVAVAAGATEAPKALLRKGPLPLAESDGPKVTIFEYDNGDVSPWAEFFAFDSPAHPKLLQLRQQYKLDGLVKDAKTDLARALILKKWVVGALKFGRPAPEVFSDWSAVALLERVKKGRKVWCGQAAMVFQQACMAMGLPARFIELGIPSNPACHFTTEVYLREHGKWAVIDATPLRAYDVYYTVAGVPQSALEMHRRVVRNGMAKVTEMHPDRAHAVRGRSSPAWAFYYVRWLTRCDVVTNTPAFVDMENTFDRMHGTVEWVDDETVPWEKQKQSIWWTRNVRLSAWNTSDPAVVNWEPTDRVNIVLRPAGSSRRRRLVFVHFWTADPAFDHLQVKIDSGGWQDLPKNNMGGSSLRRYGWGLRKLSMPVRRGAHDVRVRIVRGDGSVGPESYVKFRVN